ncbi:hypothetical protein DFH08DRAFT_827677 [Mycena albidolilacea]|uniref:Uncharacterized protein n=1 Tax=Mycena albidolilacea TaxID=1033008 RepID=A0AAD7E7X0_9AGAR|nr:hypothetical protein DFH08DRAFT_827677 [Mycena albidolilacea]
MPDAAIRWPHGRDEFQAHNDLIVARHPRLTGAFASIDGLNLLCQTSDDEEIKNATYNGWLCEHFQVGINQIRNVYIPLWKQTREEERVWGNFENMLFGEQHRSDCVGRFHNVAIYQ